MQANNCKNGQEHVVQRQLTNHAYMTITIKYEHTDLSRKRVID